MLALLSRSTLFHPSLKQWIISFYLHQFQYITSHQPTILNATLIWMKVLPGISSSISPPTSLLFSMQYWYEWRFYLELVPVYHHPPAYYSQCNFRYSGMDLISTHPHPPHTVDSDIHPDTSTMMLSLDHWHWRSNFLHLSIDLPKQINFNCINIIIYVSSL